MASGFTYSKPLKIMHLWIICFVVVCVIMLSSLIHNKKDNDSGTKHDVGTKHDIHFFRNVKSHNMNRNKMAMRVFDMNTTHIKGVLMEHVNLNYPRNIYFTIKTSSKLYGNRLFPLMLTWLQTVDKHKVSFITNKSAKMHNYVYMIRKAGFHIIDTTCSDSHTYEDIYCKASYEFDAYYKTVEAHPDKKDDYQWFCHLDDDMYVNILQLSQLLQQYDSHKPYYVGKWPISRRGNDDVNVDPVIISKLKKYNIPVKKKSYKYATGAAYCISYTLMMEAKEFLHGPETFQNFSVEANQLGDDVTMGFVIYVLLGYNLTDATNMTNQYDDYVSNSTLKELLKYSTVSTPVVTNNNLEKLATSLKTPLQLHQPNYYYSYMLYHCLLYPTVSWCGDIREKLNGLLNL